MEAFKVTDLVLHRNSEFSLSSRNDQETLSRVESRGQSPNGPSGIRTGGECDGLLGTATAFRDGYSYGMRTCEGRARALRRVHSCMLDEVPPAPGLAAKLLSIHSFLLRAMPSSGPAHHPTPPSAQTLGEQHLPASTPRDSKEKRGFSPASRRPGQVESSQAQDPTRSTNLFPETEEMRGPNPVQLLSPHENGPEPEPEFQKEWKAGTSLMVH